MKADAIPGRLNQVSIYTSRPGIFYGQCSEICGASSVFRDDKELFIREIKANPTNVIIKIRTVIA